MTQSQIDQFGWYQILSPRVRSLVDESMMLYEQVSEKTTDNERDYGFVVFPAAKAYEGFLKEYFYQLGMISEAMLKAEHFRLGKALNPDLPIRYRDDGWLYDDLVKTCGEEVALELWRAWKEGRNQVFHYDYNAADGVSLVQAKQKLQIIFKAMEKAERCGTRIKSEDYEGR